MTAQTGKRGRPRFVECGVTIGFTPEQIKYLDREAAARATSIATIVREALTEKMVRHKAA